MSNERIETNGCPQLSKNKQPEDKKSSSLARISLITSLIAIPFYVLCFCGLVYVHAIEREYTDNPSKFVSVMEKLFIVCAVLPIVPVLSGILALIDIRLYQKKLYGKMLAIRGIIIGIISYVIFWASVMIWTILNLPA